jgi:hypothetical protein
MGSMIEINDTLAITSEQGFPKELDLETHLKNPLKAEEFSDRVFEFKNKKDIRLYQIPPVRNFFVEVTKEGKWIYWGLVHILEITSDYKNKMTSGKFKIININTPEEMKAAFKITDRRSEMDYFAN